MADAAEPDSLTDDERMLVEEVKAVYKNRLAVGCTTCGYCLPCPEGVAITSCFNMLNSASLFGTAEQLKQFYPQMIAEENRAAVCTECGECEEKCPQELPIREKLKEVVDLFESA